MTPVPDLLAILIVAAALLVLFVIAVTNGDDT